MLPLRRVHVQISEHARILTSSSRRLQSRYFSTCTMKRLASPSTGPPSSKRARMGSPASDDSGKTGTADWPAKEEEMEAARHFILDWSDNPYFEVVCVNSC